MQSQTANRRIWIWMTVLILIFILLSYLFYAPNQKEYPDFVSESPSPTGVKAFYTYLNQEFDSVQRFHYSSEQLPTTDQHQLLIMVEPFIMPDSNEMKAYQAYMEAGNTVLLLSRTPDGLFDLETEPTEVDKMGEEDSVIDQSGMEQKALISNPLRLVAKEEDEIILHDKEGPIALRRPYGHGQLYVINSPEWISNKEIANNDHIPLILSFLNEMAPKEILFDEYLHGSQSTMATVNAYPKWFILFMIQAALLTILWLWNTGKRFGPIFIPREDSVRFSDERLKALSSWYLKGKLYHHSLVTQVEYLRKLMQDRWGISSTKEWVDIFEEVSRKIPHIPNEELKKMITNMTNILSKKEMSKQEYLYWSKNIDRIRKEVEEG
ncbi:DUF4350 domain-containing protein [Lederbergia sp. NSJ-179]|uniref:DUF4350 domain-containing protein n=1 Tax=Lederbergia sp. NSJ-179 TaxID=2931402 RepID=UPI001FD01EF0|nr:DUF4350 domain-containing protein [Lederbergia sp. NSJ-179]MCJ7842008.1 DUF4350 domain-containing protein [Lederbergia sp. NSJ-179]